MEKIFDGGFGADGDEAEFEIPLAFSNDTQ